MSAPTDVAIIGGGIVGCAAAAFLAEAGARVDLYEREEVASAASGTLDADSLVRNADVAMYVAKHGGKGRLSVFEQPEAVAA